MPTMAAGPVPSKDRAPAVEPTVMAPMQSPPPVTMMSDAFAKDAVIAWFRGEFAAANAIIDALCGHLTQLGGATGGGGRGEGSEYDPVFAAVHRRRLNWIPILQMQKYHSIADVAVELRKLVDKKKAAELKEGGTVEKMNEEINDHSQTEEVLVQNGQKMTETMGKLGAEEAAVVEQDDSPNSDITDSGSQEVQVQQQPPSSAEEAENNVDSICSNHGDCDGRRSQIKLTKGFSGRELLKGHMVNVVKGLKLYEEVFTDSELSKLTDFVNELRLAGQNGKLSGDTFILFNQQMKGNRRELIQLGVPIFRHIQEDAAASGNQMGNLEPISPLLQSVVNHLVHWQLIAEYKRPNGVIINFYDEGEYSQPFLKPPHVDQPIFTLLLSDSTMAFGRTLVSDNYGNYKAPLLLSLEQGSLLVMRGNSADTASHVMCSSPNKRIGITFFRVRPDSNHSQSPPTTPLSGGAFTLWQPAISSPFPVLNVGAPPPNSCYGVMDAMMPQWGVLPPPPMVMLAPVPTMVLSPGRMPSGGGTGVFLPWTVESSGKPSMHVPPPRAQKGQLIALPETASEPDINPEEEKSI